MDQNRFISTTHTDSNFFHPRPCSDTGATVAFEKGRLRFTGSLGDTTFLAVLTETQTRGRVRPSSQFHTPTYRRV